MSDKPKRRIKKKVKVTRAAKKEFSISKIELVARKISSRTVSLIPKEHMTDDKGDRMKDRVLNRKLGLLTDSVSEGVYDILYAYNNEVVEFLAFALVKSNTISVKVTNDSGPKTDINQDRLAAFLKTQLDKWRNCPVH